MSQQRADDVNDDGSHRPGRGPMLTLPTHSPMLQAFKVRINGSIIMIVLLPAVINIILNTEDNIIRQKCLITGYIRKNEENI